MSPGACFDLVNPPMYVWNRFVKKKVFKTDLMTSFTLLLSKNLFYFSKNWSAIFTNSKQSKTHFGRNSVTYQTPCRAMGHFVFHYHHVTYRTPCHASNHIVNFLLVWRPPLDWQFNFNISRASCWHFWNIATVWRFVLITTIHNQNIHVNSVSVLRQSSYEV